MRDADRLSRAGVVSSVYLGNKKFGKQIDFAVKESYTHILIMGGSEAERGVVRLKDLRTREEKELPLDEAVALLAEQ